MHSLVMEINGLPLHALVVHAVVVLGPIAALAGIAYAAVPKWRDWLRWPLAVLATVVVGAVWAAYLSGEDLTEANTYGGPLHALLEKHEDRAETLRLLTTGFAVVTWATMWWHTRKGPVLVALSALMAVLAVLTLVWVVLTGDAGAQVAWYGVKG
ncbi:hypothetical protein F0U44_00615 [Nocardioides humilatus]|uniref:DUF2231 domain-containing protein n=1 Tax=Nocardioides humilatus TaxID=2607660 RepID=A0A5B1LMM4_9ACTN|nr:DUF2231 domain-containing protein [Nocardioides humilatus]KAA1420887.1 hypothetical protein F0U44_00615 [Nocardioides humilatus]